MSDQPSAPDQIVQPNQQDQPNQPAQSDQPNLLNPLNPFAISKGSVLEGMYEVGAKIHDCSMLYDEIKKIPFDEQAEIYTQISVANSVRLDTNSTLPKVNLVRMGRLIGIGFPGCNNSQPIENK